jgi:glycosyltransferase involved in cell wall biosynthesis
LDICVLNPFFYPYKGGTEKVIMEVYKRLVKNNNVTIITSAPLRKNRPSVEYIEGIKIVRLRNIQTHIPIFPMPFVFFQGLKKALVKEKSDIYHINNRYQYFKDTVNTVKDMNKKLALTIHNALPTNIDPLTDRLGYIYDYRIWGIKLMHDMDLITGVSTSTIKTTVPRRDLKKTHLVFNGVDYNNYRKIGRSNKEVSKVRNRLGFDGITILTNGRLAKQKGQIYLMEAVSELVNNDKENLNLLVIGNGPLKRRLYTAAKRLDIKDRFKIMYNLDDKELPFYYNACDIFSLPSLYEPAGLAVLEALACEMPSIVSKVGGVPEMVGSSGFYVKPKDYNDIKEKIRYVMDNRKIALKVAKSGRERMIKCHNWDLIAKQYERLFSKTIRY